jgi:hypothetical protein
VNVTAALVAVALVMRVRQWNKLLFNVAITVIASAVAAWVYEILPPAGTGIGIWTLCASLAAVLVYAASNTGLVSPMISLHSGRLLLGVLSDSSWFAPINVLLGMTGAFVGGAFSELGPIVIGMFITPVLLMRYTLAFYARRSQATISTLEDQAAALERQASRLAHQVTHDGLTDYRTACSSSIDSRSCWRIDPPRISPPSTSRNSVDRAFHHVDVGPGPSVHSTRSHRSGVNGVFSTVDARSLSAPGSAVRFDLAPFVC